MSKVASAPKEALLALVSIAADNSEEDVVRLETLVVLVDMLPVLVAMFALTDPTVLILAVFVAMFPVLVDMSPVLVAMFALTEPRVLILAVLVAMFPLTDTKSANLASICA